MKHNLLYRYRDTRLRLHKSLVALSLLGALTGFAQPAHRQGEELATSGIQINGELNEDHGEFHLVGSWLPQSEKQKPLPALMSVVAHTDLDFGATGLKQSIQLNGEALQGITTNWVFDLRGDAQIQSVAGERLKSWSVTQGLDGSRQLEIRLSDPPTDFEKDGVWPAKTSVEVLAELDYADWNWDSKIILEPLEVTSRPGSLFQGVIQARVSDPNLTVAAIEDHGVEGLLVGGSSGGGGEDRTPQKTGNLKELWFRILDPDYHLHFQLTPLSPEKRQAQFRNYQLAGALTESTARMILAGQFKVDWPQGGTLDLLSGSVAVTDMFLPEGVTLEFNQGTYQLSASAPGAYDVRVEFDVQVTSQSGWSRLEFAGPATEQAPIMLKGLDASAQFQVKGMTTPEYDAQSTSHMAFGPSRGAMSLSWKESEVAEEGRLFYSVEGLSQISIAAGLMRQVHGLEVRVTQGEMKSIQLYLHGEGEVTSVQGPDVLNWEVEPAKDGSLPKINIQLNQPKKDGVDLWVQTQTPLTPFPVKAQPIRLEPVGAIRYGGFLRLYNEGAVKLETRDLEGLSQISPTRFPMQSQSGGIRFGETPQDAQVFAYRFSNADYQLTVQADHIVPELSVSQLLIYHVGENEKAIHVELEVDIREAPLREWEIEIPADYVVSQLEAPSLADYFVSPKEGQDSRAMLRLVFGSPLQGRRAMSFRLEKNQSDNAESWTLPNVIPSDYKSLRGNLGVTADAGYRLSLGDVSGLTDTAIAYFPKREKGLQLAFRIRANDWNANVVIERLAQTIQVDALHMFSLGEGVAYGSSVFHFLISGAPINSLRFKAPEDYGNIEFIAPNLRNWRKTDNGYEIFFHSPVSGPVSVLGNFDRKFSSPEDRLAFTGMETEGAQSEQGYVVVTSDQPFRAVPALVSDGMISLEANELPEEYRLLIDTSILAAYQYTSRPFTLNLNVVSLPQSPTVNQVVDRAEFFSRITSGGQTLTEATLYVKSQGRSHLSIIAPEGFRLWTVEVDGRSVTPAVGPRPGENLAPLPQNADPDQVIQIQLQMGSENADPSALTTQLQAPALDAPLLYAEWRVETETGQGLRFLSGPIQPLEKGERSNGLTVLEKLFTSNVRNFKAASLVLGFVLLFMGGVFWKWTLKSCRYQWTSGYSLGFIIGSLSLGIGFAMTLVNLTNLTGSDFKLPSELNFVAPFQDKSTNLSLELERVSDSQFRTEGLLAAWPALIGLALLLVPTLESFKEVCRPHRTMMNSFALACVGWGCLYFVNGAVMVVAGLMLGMAYYWIRYLGSALMSLPSKPRPPKPPTPTATPEPTHPPKTQESTMPPSASPSGSASLWIFAIILAIGQLCPGNLYGQSQQAQLAQQTQQTQPQQQQQQAEYSRQAMIPAKEVAPYAQSIYETWTIQDQNVQARAEILWQAKAGDKLPFGADQAVTRSISIEPESSAEIRRLDVDLASPAGGTEFFVVAKKSGLIQIVWEYTPKLETNGDLIQAAIPTPMSLSHQIKATWSGLEWETICPRAVSIRTARDEDKEELLANLTLAPSNGSWIGWRPRGRDTKAEQSVFYVDLYHLLTPASGALEGFHYANIRPAQGQVKQLEFQVDEALTITNVRAPRLQTWRFDPDQNLLRIQLEEGQSQSFNVIIESQISAGSLPYERKLGLLSSTQAANQVGMVGIATRPEAQLDSVEVEGLAQINLEDFPQEITASAQTADPLTLRRAYRTSSDSPSITLKVSAVKPDIRVVSEENLSLGEDRVLLSSQLTVDITRTGVFQLSFNLPEGMDVESISGSALSHWAQSQSNSDTAADDLSKQVTLYLREKTEGRQTFSIQLVGPGIQPQSGWNAPKLVLNEASKSQGRITLAPEQGLRLHLIEREAVTLMESNSPTQRPAARNYLAFQILNTRWKLGFDIEQVPAWIQVNTLQEVTFKEGVEQSVTYYDYNVENAGVKSLKIQVPSDAESVRVEGDSITDAVRVFPVSSSNAPQFWEVKLGKRILGPYSFSVRHQRPMQDQPSSNTLKGAPAVGVDLQRGYLALRSTGRVQLNVPEETIGLQALSDWQTLPAGLRAKSGESAPNYVFRVMDPNYALDFNWTRYTAAKMDQAKIESMTLSSVLSEGEAILTHVRLEILPGDLRALEIQLPESSDFWFAFVNQQSVAPWSVNETILTPLEPSAIEGEATVVEFLYTTPNPYGAGFKSWRNISAPKFGLPIENISWNIYSPTSWKLTHWGSNFQFNPQIEDHERNTSSWSGSYLETENNRQQQKVMEANEFFNLGNSLLEKGQNKDAMRAYEAALNMSNNDVAFNEDARVQLDNVKMLNFASGLNQRFQNVYGQELAQNQLDSEVMADESVMNALARRLVEQQEAAAILPRAIRASLPEIGDKLVFERALQADSDAALKLQIRFETPSAVVESWGWKLGALLALFVIIGLTRKVAKSPVGI